MKNTIYLFVLSLLIGFSSAAFSGSNTFAGGYSTWQQAQAAAVAVRGNDYVSQGACSGQGTQYATFLYAFVVDMGSDNYSYYCYGAPCPDGTSVDQTTGQCKTACTSGQSSTASYYVPGYWSTGPAETDHVQVGTYNPPSSLCDGQCRGNVNNIVVGSCSGSSETGGTVASPVPIHCDYSITLDGSTCSGDNGNAPVWNPSTDHLCANGASDYPTCTPPTNTCSNGATDYPTCTPPTGTCANGATDYPTCTSPQTGTCSNGATNYPTCTTGGSGSGETGTCANGASNYPTCTTPSGSGGEGSQKIDESGTPTGVNSDGSDALDKAAAERELGFADNTKRTDIPWSFQFSIPATACSPIEWSVYGRPKSVDLCPMLAKVREALAYLWYGLACIYCWKRVTSSTGAQA